MAQRSSLTTRRTHGVTVCLLCVLVVILSVNAKLSLYTCLQSQTDIGTHAGHLLTADQKMEVRAVAVFVPALALLALLLPFIQAQTERGELAPVAAARALSGFSFERFVRPPPRF